jgi:HEPN domain-containing protein
MSLNPLNEARYRHKLAIEHLERTERLFSLKDWVGAVSSSQLAIESFAKSLIALFEVPTWSHDPSNQPDALISKMPRKAASDVKQLAALVLKMAPEHGRSSYGEPNAGLVPSDIYREKHALEAIGDGRKAGAIAERVLKLLDAEL